MKGVIAMQNKEIESIIRNATESYTEFVTSMEILIPKTKIGKKVGNMKMGNNMWLALSPKVIAEPIVEMKLIAGVPIIITSNIQREELKFIPIDTQTTGVKSIIGRQVVTQ